MPTSKPKTVKIELTPKQREKLHKLTGGNYDEVEFQVGPAARSTKKALAAKAAPSVPVKLGTTLKTM